MAGVAGGGERVEDGLREVAAAPAVVGDRQVVAHGVVDGQDGIGVGAVAGVVQELEGRNLGLPQDAGDAEVVVADGPEDAGRVAAVAVVVQGPVVVGDEVPADEVIGVGGVAVLRVAGIGPAAHAGVVALGVQDHR